MPARPKGSKRVKGFQTGDHVRAVIPRGKYKGTHVGRVIIRASGSFDIKTKSGKVSANWKYCKLLQRDDGYEYSHVPPRPRRQNTLKQKKELANSARAIKIHDSRKFI